MVDDRKPQDRPLQRLYEGHRLEEQLCSLAYGYVWPVIRKAPRASGPKVKQRHCKNDQTATPKTRRA
jgi:hypothetical protein